MTHQDINASDDQFSALIGKALDELPEEFVSKLDNVVITYEDNPSLDQRKKLRLRCDQSLFGLYEGIPLTKRNAAYNLVLPDKITLFKTPLLRTSSDEQSFFKNIKHTLWHEIAHYFGLDHDQIHAIEARWTSPKP